MDGIKKSFVYFILGIIVTASHASLAQEELTRFGVQFKPMVPTKFFGSGPESTSSGDLTVDFTPRLGFNFGMFIRREVSDKVSIESGISLVHRNYYVDFHHAEVSGARRIDFRFVGYEIPLQALFFVQLDKHIWMNGSGGFSLDMYPSNVQSQTFERRDSTVFDFEQKTWRNGWLQFSVLANYGFEWRTPKKGSVYLGASYHRPFSSIAETFATFKKNNYPTELSYSLSGTYLTVDLRYIFHEASRRK